MSESLQRLLEIRPYQQKNANNGGEIAEGCKMKLDEIDRNILAELQNDGRMTINDLAEKVGLSPTPCLRRIKRLRDDGVIKSYTAHVDQVVVGLPVSVFVNVTLVRQVESELEAFEAAVTACPEVMECYMMTGTCDYLLRIVASDLAAYERFLKSVLTPIPGIANIQSSFALRHVVQRTALPIAISSSNGSILGRL